MDDATMDDVPNHTVPVVPKPEPRSVMSVGGPTVGPTVGQMASSTGGAYVNVSAPDDCELTTSEIDSEPEPEPGVKMIIESFWNVAVSRLKPAAILVAEAVAKLEPISVTG